MTTTPHASEARAFATALELREAQAVGGGGRYNYLEGRAVPFDTWADIGWFMEQHAADSFKRSTKSNAAGRLPLLLFHDNRSFPIGHAEKWTHEDGGLDGLWRLNDSAEAQRAGRAAETGDLLGMSIGFAPVRSDWEYVEDWNPDLGADHKDRVTRLESRLLEVSLTPTPAFVDAGVGCVRTAFDLATRSAMARELGRRDVDSWRDVLEGLRSSASD